MKKRWISLLVENEIGVLARVSGLFSGKCYNLNSLTVGVTEEDSISRMTISLTSDDQTFEQIKKQLNRSVEVIKVIDFTGQPMHLKELMFIKVQHCTGAEITDLFRMAQVFDVQVIDYHLSAAVIESVHPEETNHRLAEIFKNRFPNRINIVRSGSAGIEAIQSL